MRVPVKLGLFAAALAVAFALAFLVGSHVEVPGSEGHAADATIEES